MYSNGPKAAIHVVLGNLQCRSLDTMEKLQEDEYI